ncbi:MAG: biotin/lipoyl-containing protein, partial [Nevskiales bacterium]
MAKHEIRVPDIGDFDAVPVIEVLVSVGDQVDKEQALITLESDKATMDVPSTEAGTVAEIKVKEGDEVKEGDLIVILDISAQADEAKTDQESEAASEVDTRQAQETTEAPQQEAQAEADPESADASDNGEAGQSQTIEVTVPDIGDFDNVPVIEVLVAVGDAVTKEQSLITL